MARMALSGAAPVKVLAILLIDGDVLHSGATESGAREALSAAGMTAWASPTVAGALAAAQNFDPDVVLVNGDLPGFDALDALKQLRQTDGLRAAPVILFTEKHLDPTQTLEGDAAAFDAILPAPLHARALPQVIERVAHRRRSQRRKGQAIRVVENGRVASQSGTEFRAVID